MFRSSDKAQKFSSEPACIGADIRIAGEIDSAQEIHLSGEVVGNLSSPKVVVLAEGRLEGNIRSEAAIIAGHVTGDITTDHLSITSSAHVRGTLSFAEIEIAQGADVAGEFIKTDARSADEAAETGSILSDSPSPEAEAGAADRAEQAQAES